MEETSYKNERKSFANELPLVLNIVTLRIAGAVPSKPIMSDLQYHTMVCTMQRWAPTYSNTEMVKFQ